jgi:ribonuclease HII
MSTKSKLAAEKKAASKSLRKSPKKSPKKKTKKKIKWQAVDWRTFSPEPVIGVDEVGRGCLAGPVYAAAVILNPEVDVSEYTDSKLIAEPRRKELAEQIKKHHQFGVGFATVEEIDELNIFQASCLAMQRAIEALGVTGGHVLVDGKFPIKCLKGYEQTPIIKGDLRCKAIAAASIVAKVARDEYMKELHQEYPQYGLKAHKGYATPLHRKLIKTHKPTIIHRKTFAGVKEHL